MSSALQRDTAQRDSPAVPQGGSVPKGAGGERFALKLSTEARAFLDEANLDGHQREVAEMFLMARLFQKAWWESDVGSGDAEVTRAAAEMEVNLEMARAAVTDVLDPVKFHKHLFLNGIASSLGNLGACLEAYEQKEAGEAKHGVFVFEERDAKPYIRQLDIAFSNILKLAKEGNPEARELMRKLLKDLADVPGVQFKGWIGRALANAAPNDAERMQRQEVMRKKPNELDALIRRFVNGGDLQLTAGAPALPA